MRTLALVEVALFAVNLLIALILGLDISESLYALQRIAVSVGFPLRLLYAFISTLILLAPCFLMGVTMPLVSEAAQRQFEFSESHFLTILFFLNTLGAAAGALASGFLLIPYWGQRVALLFGAGFNLLAGLTIFGLYFCKYSSTVASSNAPSTASQSFLISRIRPEEWMAFFLGFMALGYEMYLFRIVALAHQPLPHNFSVVLCFYLVLWSAGVFWANRIPGSVSLWLVLTTLMVLLAPIFFYYRIWTVSSRLLFQILQILLSVYLIRWLIKTMWTEDAHHKRSFWWPLHAGGLLIALFLLNLKSLWLPYAFYGVGAIEFSNIYTLPCIGLGCSLAGWWRK
jgi:hypothetical protein